MPKIRPPLYIVIFAVLFVGIAIFAVFHGVMAYTENRLTVNEYSRSMVSHQRRTISHALNDKFSIQAKLDELAAHSIPALYANGGLPAVEEYLLANLNYFDEVSATFFTTVDDEFGGYVHQADYLHMYSNENTDYAIQFAKTSADGVDADVVNSRAGFYATARPWYTSALQSSKAGFSEVFTYHAYATLALPHSLPVYNDNGELLGVVGSNIFLGQFGGFLQELMASHQGVAVILDGQDRLIASSLDVSPIFAEENRSSMINAADSTNAFVKLAQLQNPTAQAFSSSNRMKLPDMDVEGINYKTATFAFDQIPNLNWKVTLFIPEQDFHQTVNQLLWQQGSIMATTLLLALALAWWLSRNISHPITSLIERFSRKDTDFSDIQSLSNHSVELREVTSLKSAFVTYQQKLKGYVDSLKDKIEENQQQLEQIRKLALVSQSIEDMSVILTLEGRIDWANYPFFDYLGLNKAKVGRKRLSELPFDAPDKQQILIQLNHYFQTEAKYYGKQGFQAAVGDNQYFEFRYFPVTSDKDEAKILILIRDISGQVTYQEELAIWKRVFESTKVGIAVSLGNNQFIDIVNPAFAQIYGGNVEDYKGTDIATFYPEDAQETPDQLREMVNEKGELTIETEHVRKDGERFPALLSANFVYNENGKILARVASVTDLTEPKQLQKQLFQSQKMHAIGSLAGGIVHDMNNVLGAILGNAELGLIYNQDSTEAAAQKNNQLFNAVMNAAKRGSKLSQQVLSFTRMEAVQMAPVEVSKLLRETVELVRVTLTSNIKLSTQSSISDIDAILGNESQLQQVFLNLLNNSVKAIKKANVEEGHIELQASIDDKDRLWVSISDNGCGIPDDIQPFVFDPFFTTEAKGQGTGLGLAIVKRIITAHNGEIRLQSKFGQGTRFDLWFSNLLLCDGSPRDSDKAITKERRDWHIVIVDDDEALLNVWTELFELTGIKVASFTDSQHALDYCLNNAASIDCIFTDFDMPGLNGEKLCEEIRKEHPELKIIMATGFSELMSEEKVQELRISKLLFKPVAFEDLMSELEALMGVSA